MNPKPCPFCSLPASRIVQSNDIALVIRDAFPISPGHTLVIPKRHIGSFFELTEGERVALFALVVVARTQIENEYRPSAYNIGINDGAAAGQTIPHLHVHLIPRYEGDCQDPRGGVRWIIPEKADYWSKR